MEGKVLEKPVETRRSKLRGRVRDLPGVVKQCAQGALSSSHPGQKGRDNGSGRGGRRS